MSQSNEQTTIVSRYEIGLSNALKDAMQLVTDEMRLTREAIATIKPINATGGLLAAMQAEAVNNDQPELKQLGQWVFEGQDEFWQSAAIDTATGKAHLHNYPLSLLHCRNGAWVTDAFATHKVKLIDGYFDISKSVMSIQRETVNDVDYLSNNDLNESVPHIDDILDQPNWLSDSVPQITQADMQLIFIQNLSSVLIQRMHSMNRFSEDDYGIGGNALEAWDILVNLNGDFGIAIGSLVHHESPLLNRVRIARFHKSQCTTFTSKIFCPDWRYEDQDAWHTIAEAQLPAFRAALEACYA